MAGEHGTYSSYVIQRCRYRADEIADRLHVGASRLKSKLAGEGHRELLDRITRPRADDGHLPTASRPTRTGRAAKAA